MRLEQAIDYHSDICLAGLMPDGTWDPCVSKGSLLVYDQFISARSFGLMMRLFQSSTEDLVGPGFFVVRLPTGTTFLVKSHNEDIGYEVSRVYAHTYLLLEVTHSVEIITMDTKTAASGMQSDTDERVDTAVWGNMERLTSSSSEDFPSVKYTGFILTLPGDTYLSTDQAVRIDDQYYDVSEVWTSSLVVQARVSKRGPRA